MYSLVTYPPNVVFLRHVGRDEKYIKFNVNS